MNKLEPQRLPALAALRAFEAAARHLSFTRAAEELNISQSAISHQVRNLEGDLGRPLFERRTRALALTPMGGRLAEAANAAFATLQEAVAEVRKAPLRSTVTLSLSYPIGASWLVRHLGPFARQHPTVEVRLHYSWELEDLAREGCDFAIRWGRGGWKGLSQRRLFAAPLMPFCRPGFLEGTKPDALLTANLLHLEDHEDWSHWFQAAGLPPAAARRGAILGDALALNRSAAAGDGVTLNRLPLVLEELARGSLVAPFRTAIEEDCAYWLVRPDPAPDNPAARALIDHLSKVAARDRKEMRTYTAGVA